MLEIALNHEVAEHLGREKNGPVRNETGNVGNWTQPKTVLGRGHRPGPSGRATGPGRHVRPADRQEAAAQAQPNRRDRTVAGQRLPGTPGPCRLRTRHPWQCVRYSSSIKCLQLVHGQEPILAGQRELSSERVIRARARRKPGASDAGLPIEVLAAFIGVCCHRNLTLFPILPYFYTDAKNIMYARCLIYC